VYVFSGLLIFSDPVIWLVSYHIPCIPRVTVLQYFRMYSASHIIILYKNWFRVRSFKLYNCSYANVHLSNLKGDLCYSDSLWLFH
jgi:hypothetical protein